MSTPYYKTIRTTHMSISVEGALKLKDSQLHKWEATDNNGNRMTGKEVRAYLEKARFEGKRVIPMSECNNFSYQNGCAGHDVVAVYYDIDWEEGNG